MFHDMGVFYRKDDRHIRRRRIRLARARVHQVDFEFAGGGVGHGGKPG